MENTTTPKKKNGVKKLLIFLIPLIILIIALMLFIFLGSEDLYTVTEAHYESMGIESTTLEYIYDDNGRLTSVLADGMEHYVYSYSDDFKTVTVENKNDNTQKTVRFNDDFDVIERIYSDGTSESYTYEKGKLVSSKNISGVTCEYTYKGKKVINESYSNGDTVDYEYSWSRILSETVTTATGDRYFTFYYYNEDKTLAKKDMIYDAVDYVYDKQKRVSGKSNLSGATMTFTYDEHDNITSITFPAPAVMKYTYEKVNISKDIYKQNKALITYNDVIDNESYELLR